MRSAEEWAQECGRRPHLDTLESPESHLPGLCPDCASAYARECVEAMREENVRLRSENEELKRRLAKYGESVEPTCLTGHELFSSVGSGKAKNIERTDCREQFMTCENCELLLAQVAVLWAHLEQVERGAPYKPYAQADEQMRLSGAVSILVKRDIDTLRENLPTQARALLDRLDALERSEEEFKVKWKRAEAVVKAFKVLAELMPEDKLSIYAPIGTRISIGNAYKALAAWEEYK